MGAKLSLTGLKEVWIEVAEVHEDPHEALQVSGLLHMLLEVGDPGPLFIRTASLRIEQRKKPFLRYLGKIQKWEERMKTKCVSIHKCGCTCVCVCVV